MNWEKVIVEAGVKIEKHTSLKSKNRVEKLIFKPHSHSVTS